MDSFELNKVLGAILGTCLVLLVTSFTAGAIFTPVIPEKPGYEIVAKEAPEGGAKQAAPALKKIPAIASKPIRKMCFDTNPLLRPLLRNSAAHSTRSHPSPNPPAC